MGNLISILTMVRLSILGIRPILLIGGATGLIGDPSGKTTERNMLSKEDTLQNVKGIEETLRNCTHNIYAYLEKNKEQLEIQNVPSSVRYIIINKIQRFKLLSFAFHKYMWIIIKNRERKS